MVDDVIISDVLIIGTGISGLSAALRCAEAGKKVILVTKQEDPLESNSRYAQGGIIGTGIDDSPELLSNDILEAGAGLTYSEAANFLAVSGPQFLKKFIIEKWKVDFEKLHSGEFDLTKEAAHSRRRIYHSKDSTGKAIVTILLSRVKSNSLIRLITDHTAIDLITSSHHLKDINSRYEENRCLGAYFLNNITGAVNRFLAQNTIIATGGLGRIYLYSTNPKSATGDGIAMATRAGCEIINAEFVQFHPTTLKHRDAENFLISESVRGEGGRLVNDKNEFFMEKYAGEMKELAPRDVVSRAIYEELTIRKDGAVYLDLKGIDEKGVDVKDRFPAIYENCLKYDIDITRQRIPVVPAAHYFCGGIKVDLTGKTSIKNLYAIGEASCTGLHGANRLASTSLLEGLTWGIAASEDIIKMQGVSLNESKIPEWKGVVQDVEIDPVLINQDWHTIQNIMWNYAGIVRTNKRLQRAVSDLEYLYHRVYKFYFETKLTRNLIELRNGLLVAKLIANAALRNNESQGCHFKKE